MFQNQKQKKQPTTKRRAKKAIQAGKNRTNRDGEERMSKIDPKPQPLLLSVIWRSDLLNGNVGEASNSKGRSASLLLQSQHAAVDKAIPTSLSETELAHITLGAEQILFDSLLDLCNKLNNALGCLGVDIRDVESMHGILDRDVQRGVSLVQYEEELFLQRHTGGVKFAIDIGAKGFVCVHEVVEGWALGSGCSR